MAPQEFSRRSFVATAGAAMVALPVLAQSRGSFTPAAAAVPAAQDLQQLQADFVDLRFGMFLHYSLGTYTDEEWAAPNQSPSLFAPSSVDCAQWAAAATSAKMQYAVLTTKHHDGFSLWPTSQGTQNVAHSGYREDVVRRYVDAFRAEGLKVGFYFSIWDRTAGIEGFGGHVPDSSKSIEPADMDVILAQLTELLTNYGPIDLLMTDGYTWQMGTQALSYARIRELVKELQPDCLLSDICAVTEPWLGDIIFWEEPLGIRVPAGNTHAGLQGQTISNGWFWHPSTPGEPLMSTADILQHIDETEPNYTSFLLNCPPNRQGRLDDNIVQRLAQVGAAWSGPNLARAALPAQGDKVLWPIIPVAAYATRFNTAFDMYEVPYKAIDGRGDRGFETCWSTWAPDATPKLPATLVVDLGGLWSGVTTFEYLPKQWNRNGTDGDVLRAKIWLSNDGVGYDEVAEVLWSQGKASKTVEWPARDAAYVKFEILEATGGYVNVNGIKIGGRTERPQRRTSPLASTKVQLVDAVSGRALTSDGSGVALAEARPGASDWRVVQAEDNYFHLENVQTALALGLTGTARSAGAGVELAPKRRGFGQHWAISRLGTGEWVLTNRFTMLSLGAAGAPADTVSLRDPSLSDESLRWTIVPVDVPVPAITLDSGAVQAGSTLTVSGSGFAAGDQVQIVLDPGQSPLGSAAVDGAGRFSAGIVIPSSTAAGSRMVRAIASPSGSTAEAPVTVTVASPGTDPGTGGGTGNGAGTGAGAGAAVGGGAAATPGTRAVGRGALAATGDAEAGTRVAQGIVASAAALLGGSLIVGERRRARTIAAEAVASQPTDER